MKAIITAGGKGTRMRPLTFSSNKHFIPLANKPLLFYAIETVIAGGIKNIGINYNPGQLEEIKNFLGDGKRWGVKFTYILQEAPLGLAHIIKISQPFLKKDKFLMHLGDNIFYGGIKPLIDFFLKENLNALLPVVHHKENSRLGVPYFNKNGKLIRCVEKPKNPPHDWAVPGLYFFDYNIFKCFAGRDGIVPSSRGELEISAAYQWLIDKGYNVATKEFDGHWKDPGKFDDWLDTNQFLLDMETRNGTESKLGDKVIIEGKVRIGKHCKIRNSHLRGPSAIGDGVTIKDSYIGPYSSINEGCVVEKARIENSILLKNVRVIHPTNTLESCLIGEGTLIEGNHQKPNEMKLFVGNQCILKV